MIDLCLDRDTDDGATLFANSEWSVLADGLEHRGTGYFIARENLAVRRPDRLWDWPLHLAEKSWCTPRLLREAFMVALERFGIVRDEHLARSFVVGFGLRTGAQDGAQEGFVALGDLVRPKSSARKRPASGANRSAARGRIPVRERMAAGVGA